MLTQRCQVKRAVEKISKHMLEEPVHHALCRQRLDVLVHLLDDLSNGRGRPSHIDSIENMITILGTECDHRVCAEIRQMLTSDLANFREIYESHIDSHYCPAGECETLSAPPCQLACPASVDIPSYVTLVGMGRYHEAMEVLLEDLPLPGSLGRVCVRPCERACRRGKIDSPIAICQLKRVAFDRALAEDPSASGAVAKKYDDRIAIIGSGPAGLSTAYFLAKIGYRPTIFEAMPEPGGMLRWGIPGYRLPRDILGKEIERIEALGVEILTNVKFGEHLALPDLQKQGYGAVFMGIGAWCSMGLPIEGAEGNPGVIECLTFLRHENMRQSMVGDRVIVIGGGNAAVDCIRTALRLDVKEVHLVYRRSRQEMPAHKEEVEAAEAEGARLTFLSSPVRVHTDNGRVTGLECIRNELSEPDATGRRRPVPMSGTEYVIPADTIITAIGQKVDAACLSPIGDLDLSRKQLVVVNPATMETSVPGMFAGGDVVTGPATVIEAVASGKRAADSIHRYLRGLAYSKKYLFPTRRKHVPVMRISSHEKAYPTRPVMPNLALKERVHNFEEVELGLAEEDAFQEARRCLRCDLCISCGQCVEVCRDKMGIDALHLSYVEKNASEDTDFLRPAEQCVGCGSCANICPTDAITVEDGEGERVIFMCGSEMSRHKLISCVSCGEFYVPQRQLELIQSRADSGRSTKFPRNLCPDCSRRVRGGDLAGRIRAI